MNYVLFWVYVLMFLTINILIFHFWLLRSYKQNLFKLNQKIELMEAPDSYSGTNIATFFRILFWFPSWRKAEKQHNQKLLEKYGPDKIINRWSRMLIRSKITILILIIIFSITSVVLLEDHNNIPLNSLYFFKLIIYAQILILISTVSLIFLKWLMFCIVYSSINVKSSKSKMLSKSFAASLNNELTSFSFFPKIIAFIAINSIYLFILL